jgi:hypothetical protein
MANLDIIGWIIRCCKFFGWPMDFFPKVEGDRVYFWFVQFYDYIFFPSMIIFPISLIIVVLWFSRLVEIIWVQKLLQTGGVIIFSMCFLYSLPLAMIFPEIIIVGHVEKNGQNYYLIKYYDDLAFDFAFCESDKVGFSGHC